MNESGLFFLDVMGAGRKREDWGESAKRPPPRLGLRRGVKQNPPLSVSPAQTPDLWPSSASQKKNPTLVSECAQTRDLWPSSASPAKPLNASRGQDTRCQGERTEKKINGHTHTKTARSLWSAKEASTSPAQGL